MTTLFELQNEQVCHDKRYHRDVFFLNYQDRFKHLVMHYGKYAGRLSRLLQNKTTDEIQCDVKRTMVDCFIIVLSSADLLHLNLNDKLKEKLENNDNSSLSELILDLKNISLDLYDRLSVGDRKNNVLNLIIEYTPIAGDLLKAGEDLDHMVGFNIDAIREKTLDILNIVLLSSLIWNIDLECETHKRWDYLKNKTTQNGPQ